MLQGSTFDTERFVVDTPRPSYRVCLPRAVYDRLSGPAGFGELHRKPFPYQLPIYWTSIRRRAQYRSMFLRLHFLRFVLFVIGVHGTIITMYFVLQLVHSSRPFSETHARTLFPRF